MCRGILVIAHGSSSTSWVDCVDEAIRQVSVDDPIVTCFLEMVEGRTIDDGVNQLEALGVTRIDVIPLFVSSGSTHIDEIAHILKKFGDRIQHFFTPMDAHPVIVQIVLERAMALSHQPTNEILFLVGHGSVGEPYQSMWERSTQRLANQLQQRSDFVSVEFESLYSDRLYQQLQAAAEQKTVNLVPLFLSEGYFTKQVIPKLIKGLPVNYSGETYLPHPLIVSWIEETEKHRSADHLLFSNHGSNGFDK